MNSGALPASNGYQGQPHPVLWFQMSGATHPLSPPAFIVLTGTNLPMYEMVSDRDEIFAHH